MTKIQKFFAIFAFSGAAMVILFQIILLVLPFEPLKITKEGTIMNIKIKEDITLTINDKEIKLTKEEASQLYLELQKIVDNKEVIHVPFINPIPPFETPYEAPYLEPYVTHSTSWILMDRDEGKNEI